MPDTIKHATWARYEASTHVLEVDFPGNPNTGKPGTTYKYEWFPPEEWAAMKVAPNHARFFAMRIRGKYPATKIR